MSPAVTIRKAQPADIPEISKLHARVFGPGRFVRSAYRVRERKGHLSRYCLVAHLDGALIASLRMTEIAIGGTSGAALLGPVAVEPKHRGCGIGTRLVKEALAAARTEGTALVVLVGDEPYYGRFGFTALPPGQIVFPGPVNPRRILAVELIGGSCGRYRGMIVAEPPSAIGS
jgi:predicted N-acetyltransferase YhbS